MKSLRWDHGIHARWVRVTTRESTVAPSWFQLLRRRVHAATHALRLKNLARRCVLPPDVLALMPGPLDVFKASLEDVAKQAAEFASAVSKVREDFESHFRDNRKRVIADAWEIAHTIEPEEERYAYEFACACLTAHRSTVARALLSKLAESENRDSKYVTAARRRVARDAWKQGNIDAAVKSLRGIRGRSAKSQYRNWLGVSTIRNGLFLAESGAPESGRAVISGGLLATGMEQEIATGITAIYLKATNGASLDALESAMPSGTEPETAAKNALIPIILSGFGWSGSGAVADLLKGHPRVDDVFSGREIGTWTARYGLDRLYAHFATRGYNRRLLLEFLTRHCFGHSFLADSRGTKSLGGIWSMLSETNRWPFLAALASWLTALQDWKVDSTRPLLTSFQHFSARLLRLLASTEARCVLLSNCVPSDAIAGTRMFEKPVVIVSWRDPGDAFASKLAAFPEIALEFERWQRQLSARINSYLEQKTEVVENARLWFDVSFEEFVHSESLRKSLLESLELDGDEMRDTFDPSVSAKNIGILHDVPMRQKSAWASLADDVATARKKAEFLSGTPDNDNKSRRPPLASKL